MHSKEVTHQELSLPTQYAKDASSQISKQMKSLLYSPPNATLGSNRMEALYAYLTFQFFHPQALGSSPPSPLPPTSGLHIRDNTKHRSCPASSLVRPREEHQAITQVPGRGTPVLSRLYRVPQSWLLLMNKGIPLGAYHVRFVGYPIL